MTGSGGGKAAPVRTRSHSRRRPSSLGAVATLPIILLALFGVSCGGADREAATVTVTQPEGQPAETATEPAETATEPAETATETTFAMPVVPKRSVGVTWNSYGLPGTTGYQSAVTFNVRNPNTFPVYGLTYRVTLKAQSGKVLGVVSPGSPEEGSRALNLAAGEERGFVQLLDVESEASDPPDRASVTLYRPATADDVANAASYPSVLPKTAWKATNSAIVCDDGFVGCKVDFDLVLKQDGEQVLLGTSVFVQSKDGKINYALGYTELADKGIVRRREPVPVSLRVYGSDDIPPSAVVHVRVDAVDPYAPNVGD